jgi:3-methylcrotonyl-CoA carboxylase beta subunit
MGGEQAASTLLTVKLQQLEALGQRMTEEEQSAYTAPVLAKYERESSAYYSSARLWDDGILDPADTRDVLGLSLAICANAPIADPKPGVYRM